MNAELKRLKPVPEFKKKIVAELEKLIKENRTLLLASVSNLPQVNINKLQKS
jgi:ribosomal protein L10